MGSMVVVTISSSTRSILRSITLTANYDTGRYTDITHLALESSSQWVIAQNITENANIEHVNRNNISFMINEEMDQIEIIKDVYLSYINIDRFCHW